MKKIIFILIAVLALFMTSCDKNKNKETAVDGTKYDNIEDYCGYVVSSTMQVKVNGAWEYKLTLKSPITKDTKNIVVPKDVYKDYSINDTIFCSNTLTALNVASDEDGLNQRVIYQDETHTISLITILEEDYILYYEHIGVNKQIVAGLCKYEKGEKKNVKEE